VPAAAIAASAPWRVSVLKDVRHDFPIGERGSSCAGSVRAYRMPRAASRLGDRGVRLAQVGRDGVGGDDWGGSAGLGGKLAVEEEEGGLVLALRHLVVEGDLLLRRRLIGGEDAGRDLGARRRRAAHAELLEPQSHDEVR